MDIAANSTLKEQSDTENDVELHDNPVLQVPYFKSRVRVKRGRDWNREDQDGNSEDNSDGDGMEQCYRIQNPTVLETDRKPANKKIKMASSQNFMISYGLKDYDSEDWSNSSVQLGECSTTKPSTLHPSPL